MASTASATSALTAPVATVAPAAGLMMAHDPGAPRCEEIRALRGQLLRGDNSDRGDVIALLSPNAGEGRSLLAAELAIGLALAGQSTLLVDGDLRHPRQHLLFGARELRGLAEALNSGAPPQVHAVQGIPALSLLAAGNVAESPGELLFEGGFTAMVQDWRKQYRFMVIDTPPFMRFPDGMLIASCASRSIVICRVRHTPYDDIQEMLRRLAMSRAGVLGAVLNHF
jgi:receptor protein-tyrosine kinase